MNQKFRRILLITKLTLRLELSMIVPLLTLAAVPLVIMSLLRDTFAASLHIVEGYGQANGAEVIVPGQAATFAFISMSHLGVLHFGDQTWGTSDRVRSCMRPSEFVLGRTLAWAVHCFVLLAMLVGGAHLVLGLPLPASHLALLCLVLATISAAIGFAWMVFNLSRSTAVVDAGCIGGGLVMSVLGGAIIPYALLPDLVQDLSPISPVYWALRGFRKVFLDDAGLSAVGSELGVLACFAVLFGILATLCWNPERAVTGFAK
ncbi:MAG TPA: hypothetical protein DEG43_15125 [Acidimicrobiaceae bacterium]|jgi:ABC-2 type transport system permease protein|nr:hypothetical protein [Acidimicrobiaceae bacterium]